MNLVANLLKADSLTASRQLTEQRIYTTGCEGREVTNLPGLLTNLAKSNYLSNLLITDIARLIVAEKLSEIPHRIFSSKIYYMQFFQPAGKVHQKQLT